MSHLDGELVLESADGMRFRYNPETEAMYLIGLGAAGNAETRTAPTQNVVDTFIDAETDAEIEKHGRPEHEVMNVKEIADNALQDLTVAIGQGHDTVMQELRSLADQEAIWSPYDEAYALQAIDYLRDRAKKAKTTEERVQAWEDFNWWNDTQAEKGGTWVAQALAIRGYFRGNSAVEDVKRRAGKQISNGYDKGNGRISEQEYADKMDELEKDSDEFEEIKKRMEGKPTGNEPTESQSPKKTGKRKGNSDNSGGGNDGGSGNGNGNGNGNGGDGNGNSNGDTNTTNEPSNGDQVLGRVENRMEVAENWGDITQETGDERIANAQQDVADMAESSFEDMYIRIMKERGVLKDHGIFSKESMSRFEKRLRKRFSTLTAEQQESKVLASILAKATDGTWQASVPQKVRAVQVIHQLMGIATSARNLQGNVEVGTLGAISNNIAALLDPILALRTGTRTKAFEKGFILSAAQEAYVNAYLDIAADIDTGVSGKYETVVPGARDLGSRQTFSHSGGIAEKTLAKFERRLSYWLTSTDEFFKGGEYESHRRSLERLNQQGKINPDALQTRNSRGEIVDIPIDEFINNQARQAALYRTFQQDSAMSDIAIGAQSLANKLGGLGYMTMPYARVPANVISEDIDYSPIGAVRGAVDIAKILVQGSRMHNGTQSDSFEIGRGEHRRTVSAAEYQSMALDRLSRGTLGTGFVVLGAVLAKLAVAKWNDDKKQYEYDVTNVVRNMGIDVPEDERIVINGNLLPIVSNAMAIGSYVWELMDSDEPISASEFTYQSTMRMLEGVADLQVVQTIANIMNDVQYMSDDMSDIEKYARATEKELIASMSSTLLPSFVRGTAKGLDNVQRNLYTGEYSFSGIAERAGANDAVMKAANIGDSVLGADNVSNAISNIMNGIPGVRQTLPAKVDQWGETKTYTDRLLQTFGNEDQFSLSVNTLNSLVLPAAITPQKADKAAEEIARVLDGVSDDESFSISPKSMPSKLKLGGEQYELTYEERVRFQQIYGSSYTSAIETVTGTKFYQDADADTQARVLEIANTYATMQANADYFGDAYEDSTSYNKYQKLDTFFKSGLNAADYIKYEDMSDNIAEDEDKKTEFYTTVLKNSGTNVKQTTAIINTFVPYNASKSESAGITDGEAKRIKNEYPATLVQQYSKISNDNRFKRLTGDEKTAALNTVISYSKALTKSKYSDDPTSMVEKMDTLSGVGMNLMDYIEWQDTKTKAGDTTSGGGVKIEMAVTIANSNLSEDQKLAVYSLYYQDSGSVDLSDANAAFSSTVSSSKTAQRINDYYGLTSKSYQEYFNLRTAVSDYISDNNLPTYEGEGSTKKNNAVKLAVLEQVLPDFGYSGNAAQTFFNVLYG